MKKMLKKGLCSLASLALISTPVFAETIQNPEQFWVRFTEEDKMDSNFTTGEMDEVLNALQPGDTGLIEIDLVNDNQSSTEWYLRNEVVKSLEESSVASNGAYSYSLSYQGPEGRNEEIYHSETIGGEGSSNGLTDATDSLDDWFYLDTLKQGQSGKVMLEVALDGETQGNSYQSTYANLEMEFAVEKTVSGENREIRGEPTTVRRTGKTTHVDTSTLTNRLPWLLLSAASGVILLILAIMGWKENKEEKDHE